MTGYIPDKLHARLFQPWTLPPEEWPLCREDWQRVDAVAALGWKGRVLDVGAGDGTLAAMVCSRNPDVAEVVCVEPDSQQRVVARNTWTHRQWPIVTVPAIPQVCAADCVLPFDGALCCELLEHLTSAQAQTLLTEIRRALKPGAPVCVTVPTATGSRAAYPGHITLFTADALKRALSSADLDPDPVRVVAGTWLMTVAYA